MTTKTHEIKLDGYGAHTTLAEDRPIMLLGTAESYGIEMLHVVSGKSWEGLTVTATFNAPDGTSTDMLMDAEGSITVPSEATAKSGSGKIVFTGVSNGIQRISCDLEYFVVAHSAINGVQSGGTAPGWFEQAATRFMPTGGTAGQVLTKKTDADFDAEWQDSQGGAGLEPLVGTNKTLTPWQVKEAFLQGQPIVFSFIGASGEVASIFQSFEIFDDIIVASTILPLIGSQDMCVGVITGYLSSNVWEFSETLITNPDDIQTAINTALAAAKASGEFDGADGITPTIGDNGNWFLGATDTGKPSRGEKGDKGANGPQGPQGATGATGATGADGKSAYSYAQDGGYTGTEEEFAAKLAAEKLPNPYPLTFTGAVSETYDGSSAKTIEIPSGGGGHEGIYSLLVEHTIMEDVSEVVYTNEEYPGIANLKHILVSIIFPKKQTTGWWKLGAGDAVIMSTNGVSNAKHYYGAADVKCGHWIWSGAGSNNDNAGQKLSPPLVEFNPRIGFIPTVYNDYSSLRIYGSSFTLTAGTVVRIWGCD